jgi:hypothetical protein
MRLLQPEAVSGDRVSTLGQAVRREVAAMNEGIERTLARAVELETLVQSEVNQLERAYSDNEVRIRSLVSDLGNEREAVVSHAERVRSSISGAHEQLKEELSSASNIIRDNVLSASQQLSTLLSESGERLIGSINESGGAIAEAIETRTGDIGSRITTSGEAFANLLDTRIAERMSNPALYRTVWLKLWTNERPALPICSAAQRSPWSANSTLVLPISKAHFPSVAGRSCPNSKPAPMLWTSSTEETQCGS